MEVKKVVCALVGGLSVTLAVGAGGAAAAQLHWSGPIGLNRTGGSQSLAGIACPSAGRCVAVDDVGQVVTFDPAKPGGASAVPLGSGFQAVSCASVSQCTAISSHYEATFDPANPAGAKRSQIAPSDDLISVSCTGASLCAAVNTADGVVSFNPQTGTVVKRLSMGAFVRLLDISCPLGSDQCTAVDDQGTQYTFSPSTGSTVATQDIGGSASREAVSCPTTSVCAMAVSGFFGEGSVITFDPSSSSSTTHTPISSNTVGFLQVACADASSCAALDVQGDEYPLDPKDLTAGSPAPVDQGHFFRDVSCPTTTQCTAIDDGGNQVTFKPGDGSVITGPTHIDTALTTTGSSCPATNQCTAIDIAGHEITFDPTSGKAKAPVDIDSGQVLEVVSCLSTSQCTAVDSGGTAVTFNPQTGVVTSSHSVDTQGTVRALSCWSSPDCTDVDDDNYAVTFDTAGHVVSSQRVQPDTHPALDGLDCRPSGGSAQCTAVDSLGNEMTFDALTTTVNAVGVKPSGASGLFAVSCPTLTQCNAVGAGTSGGELVNFDPTTGGHFATKIDRFATLDAVSCPTVSQCTSVDSEGGVLTFDPTVVAGAMTPRFVSGGSPSISCPAIWECVITDHVGDGWVGLAAPASVKAPGISGVARVGRLLTEHHGQWSPAPASVGYRWERCNSSGVACRVIAGATAQRYVVRWSDIGHRLRVVETARNSAGPGAPAVSAATGPVAPAPITVTTAKASPVGSSAVTLRGFVNTHGQVVKWHFVWGQRAPYGSLTASRLIGSGHAKPVAVSWRLSELRPGTTYHFRLVASVSRGAGRTPLVVSGRVLAVTTARAVRRG